MARRRIETHRHSACGHRGKGEYCHRCDQAHSLETRAEFLAKSPEPKGKPRTKAEKRAAKERAEITDPAIVAGSVDFEAEAEDLRKEAARLRSVPQRKGEIVAAAPLHGPDGAPLEPRSVSEAEARDSQILASFRAAV